MEKNIKQNLLTLVMQHNEVLTIIKEIAAAGGIPYLVGGSVRDLLLDREVEDLDIEIHDIDVPMLEAVLKKFGNVRLVGKQFGVLRLDGVDVDWSLPRRDSKGRKPRVEIIPTMTIEEACRRRDVTMNAMAIDLRFAAQKDPKQAIEDVRIIDPFGGLKDLTNTILRSVDEKLFLDDPLRFYRVMQFISRFEMYPDEPLEALCNKMDLRGVASERIYEELKKLLMKSKRPSLGIRWLADIDRLQEIMPEVHALIGVKQPPTHHPEGDVFEHTMQSLDAVAALEFSLEKKERLLLMWAVLCHDLGKPVTIDSELHVYNHEVEGVPLARQFLKRFVGDTALISAVAKLVRYHLMPGVLLDEHASLKAYKRLAKKLSPEVTAMQLAFVSLCDKRGRNPHGQKPLGGSEDKIAQFISRIKEAAVEHGPEKPMLLGRHLIDIVKPGPKMGELLKKAYDIQIEEGIADVEELKRRVLEEQ